MNSHASHIAPAQTTHADFERLYLAVREQEGRVYTDVEVSNLPQVDIMHPHYAEWQIRKRSASRLTNYLGKKKRPLDILEVGCGNGWLAAKMAGIPQVNVTGMDINLVEINQASRVFRKNNLRFMYDAFIHDPLSSNMFDIIVFAAVLPYFPSVQSTLKAAVNYLKPGGEVHIIDTPFYPQPQVPRASGRCVEYYTNMGFPEMAGHYFHHTLNDLDGFKFCVLAHPGSLFNRLIRKDRFFWITVLK